MIEPQEYILKAELKEDKTLGYLYFIDYNHPLSNKYGKTYHHRHVVSVKEGRWINYEEVVHHKDSNKTNNDPDNLVVLSRSEHTKLHAQEKGKNINPIKTCPECGNDFTSYNLTYCSIGCYGLNRPSKLKDLEPHKLKELVWSLPTTQIATMFNVSDSAIGKRCKKFKIDKPPRGYWEKVYHNKLD